MSITNRYIHVENFEQFNTMKLSANAENTTYTIGLSEDVINGVPDVLYQSICWIKDIKKQWTHGQLYGGENEFIGRVTCNELRNLRNNAKLVPGKMYRITDYSAVSTQEDTRATSHRFDIIVTALTESILSEEAIATYNEHDHYFDNCNLDAWKIWYTLDTDKFVWCGGLPYKAEFVAAYRNDPENGEEYTTIQISSDKIFEWSTEYDNGIGKENIVIYKSDLNIYYEEGTIDYGDKFFYRGVVTVDGKDYDSWEKQENGSFDVLGESASMFALTERMVFNNAVVWPENNQGVIYRMIDEDGNDCPYDFKNILFKRWLINSDYLNGSFGISSDHYTIDNDNEYWCYTFNIYSLSENAAIDATVQFAGQNMVYNNVIKPLLENEQQMLSYNVFSFLLTDGVDVTTLVGWGFNTLGEMCSYNTFDIGCGYNTLDIRSSNNTFGKDCTLNTLKLTTNNSFGEICEGNNIDVGSFNNKFGINCNFNTMGTMCNNNTLNNDCTYNVFMDGAHSSFLDRGCSYNTFGDNSATNVLGDNCIYNTFGSYSQENTMGSGCVNNTIGNVSSSNTIGNGSMYNIIGINSYSNELSASVVCCKLGNGCYDNVIKNNSSGCLLGDDCTNNTIGANSVRCSLGNACTNNIISIWSGNLTIGNVCSYNTLSMAYCNNITIGDCCINNIFSCTYTGSSNNVCQNYKILGGLKGNTSSNRNHINTFTRNNAHETIIGRDTEGSIVAWCDADLQKTNGWDYIS